MQNKFSDKFGFTQDEVNTIIDYQNIDKLLYSQMQEWYNGYKFGETEGIYNPWSILNFVTWDPTEFRDFWVNTSSDDLIKIEIKNKDNSLIREDILKLINGETIEKNIEENFVFQEFKIRKQLIWTLFLYSGYLTISEKISQYKYKLRIPNYELTNIFKCTVLEWLEGDIKVQTSLLKDTVLSLVNNDLYKFEIGLKQIMGGTFSYYDTAIKHEYVYQSYLLGLLAIIGNDYILKSNRESRKGRYDIMLIPHDKTRNGIVIEIKRIAEDAKAKTINQEIDKALQQIEENEYCKELIDSRIQKDNILAHS